MTIDFRARCPRCQRVRVLVGPFAADSPAQLDAAEHQLSGKMWLTICERCCVTEQIAMFADGEQTEPWTDAKKYERDNGPDAGPLPPKPWPDTN